MISGMDTEARIGSDGSASTSDGAPGPRLAAVSAAVAAAVESDKATATDRGTTDFPCVTAAADTEPPL